MPIKGQRKQPKRKKTKQGIEYEKLVSEIIQELLPNAKVTQGSWETGPDGSRDLDVLAEGTTNNRSFRILIECKDYNPTSTGPVGIAIVDALDSKARDLSIDYALICSNAGFTADATRKSRRVNIGLISALRRGDGRIRFAVRDEIYFRRISIQSLKLSLDSSSTIDLTSTTGDSIFFNGRPVIHWTNSKLLSLLASNPLVNGSFEASYLCKAPVEFSWPTGAAPINSFRQIVELNGAWYRRTVTIDATTGIYDWLRQRAKLSSGPQQFSIGELDRDKGTWIKSPPLIDESRKQLQHGEIEMRMMEIINLGPCEPRPDLDDLIEPEDLKRHWDEIPIELTESAENGVNLSLFNL